MKTALDENASIYERSEYREGTAPVKGTWKKLDRKGKFQFFKDYFSWIVIAIVILAIFVACFIYAYTREDATVIYNLTGVHLYELDEDALGKQFDELSGRWGLRGGEIIQYHRDLEADGPIGEKNIPTYLSAGTIDALIGTADELRPFGEDFEKLDTLSVYDKIPKEALVTLDYTEADLVTMKPVDKTKCCGIYIKDTIFKDSIKSKDGKDLIIVIITNGNGNSGNNGHKEDFIKYILNVD